MGRVHFSILLCYTRNKEGGVTYCDLFIINLKFKKVVFSARRTKFFMTQ